jgi:hypothetical protein
MYTITYSGRATNYEYYADSENTSLWTCAATQQPDGYWSAVQMLWTNGVLAWNYSYTQWLCWACTQLDSDPEQKNATITIQTNETVYVYSVANAVTECCGAYSRVWRETYSGLFGTTKLIENLKTATASVPFPTNWVNGNGSASLRLNCGEREGEAAKMQYRLYFESETNMTYKLSWHEVTTNYDGTTESKQCGEVLLGTGGIVYTKTNYVVLPPDKPGYTTVQHVRGEIVPPPDSGGSSGPGAGGPGCGGGGCREGGCQGVLWGGCGANGPPLGWPSFSLELGERFLGWVSGLPLHDREPAQRFVVEPDYSPVHWQPAGC